MWSLSLEIGFALAIPLLLPFISFSTPDRFDLLHGANRSSPSSPGLVVQSTDAPGLCDGLIWPKIGYASIV
jgi:hypothetical protein